MHEAWALLIFDEVISGFRLGPGGPAEHYALQPDLATFGKVIGGGMPVGGFGASRENMKNLAPEGGVYQGGTLSGNPVAMTAGLTALKYLKEQQGWGSLEELGRYLEKRVGAVLKLSPVPACLVRIGSIFWIAWASNTPPRAAEAKRRERRTLLRQSIQWTTRPGYALAPSAYEVGFLSLAHTQSDIDRLADSLADVLEQIFSGAGSWKMQLETDEHTGGDS
ncbi:MAG: hypothetical protein CM1200mP36_10550 [Gammaproteobacteria bacterium]|nr:MAG: hypothetical protein CM1200mP36_10550 [Gammaproteobacteria bacterium]